MKNIRAVILDKYKDDSQFEKLSDYIYKKRDTSSYCITLRCELEPDEDSQYPLEDVLDKYLINVTDHAREFQSEGKRILEVELESPYSIDEILAVSEIIGKRVYNVKNDEGMSLVIEDDVSYEHSLKPIRRWNISGEIEKLRNDTYIPRDDFKSKNYYLNQLLRNNNFLCQIAENYEMGKLLKPVDYYYLNVRRCMVGIIHLFQVLNADYDVIKKYVREYFSLLEKEDIGYWGYSQEIIVLSLAYLYDIEAEEIFWVKLKMPQIKDEYIDAVLDVMRNKIFEDSLETAKDFYFKEIGIVNGPRQAKGGLVDVFNEDDRRKAIEKFAKYLTTVKEKDYQSLLKHYDEISEAKYTYYGSQCFKLTALAKMLGARKDDETSNSRFIIEDFLWGEKQVMEVETLKSCGIDVDNLSATEKESLEDEPAKDTNTYHVLPEMAEIISNGDPQVYADFKMLAEDYNGFYEKHKAWCEAFFGYYDHLETDIHENILLIFAYWLTGYETEFTYGAYIDWKEETAEIVHWLKKAIETLGYPLTLENIDDGYTDEVLSKIDLTFQEAGYRLIWLDTGGDCYHLFIATNENFEKLKNLGNSIGFRFNIVNDEKPILEVEPENSCDSITQIRDNEVADLNEQEAKEKRKKQIIILIGIAIFLAGLLIMLQTM